MTTLIGATGAGILLIFFSLNQFKKISSESLWYDLGNFVGAGLLTVYAVLLNSLPFIVLELVWVLVSLRDIVVDLKRKK